MTNQQLIKQAASVIKLTKTKAGLIGDVGCALLSDQGEIFLGICADAASNTLCAERNAIGSMITTGEFGIQKIVAVWKDKDGVVYIIPPCGNCRQFMREIHEENVNTTEVILDKDKTVKLKDLLPYYDWWKKQD